MKTYPEDPQRAGSKDGGGVTHVEITTDIAIWEPMPGLVDCDVAPTPPGNQSPCLPFSLPDGHTASGVATTRRHAVPELGDGSPPLHNVIDAARR